MPVVHPFALAATVGALLLAAAAQAAPEPTPLSPVPVAALSEGEATAILEVISHAPDHGLGSFGVAGLAARINSPSPEVRARALADLEAAALGYARAMGAGIIEARSIDSDWALRPPPYDVRSTFAAARAGGGVGPWLRSLAPAEPDYAPLVQARRRYAAAVDAGDWAPIPDGAPPHVDATDPRVPALRLRLAAEGYTAAPQGAADVFDAALAAALVLYQAHNGLPTRGVLDKATLAALNTPAAARLATIDANLERLRWTPRDLGPDRVDVDIAGAELTLTEGGVQTLGMRVIAGDVRHHTPLFAARATAVVFNPPWNVPASIASKELWPKIARDPGYMARNGFSVVNGQLRQAPGPKAALGYVKIDIDSPFGVYLHDTPSRSLFVRERRLLSHGCIRLQFPRDLATRLLTPAGWSRDNVEAAIAAKVTRRVALIAPIPVVVSYRTARPTADGTISFRPDAYGWDAKLTAAIVRRQATPTAPDSVLLFER